MTRRTSAPRLGGARAIFRPFTLLLAATVIGAVACGGGSPTGPGEDDPASGTVQLKLIEQIPVPVRIYHGPWVDHQTGRNINIYVLNLGGTGNFSTYSFGR